MSQTRFTAEQPTVPILCQPSLDADPVSNLEKGDEIAAAAVFIQDGIEWVKIGKGTTATRINGSRSKVQLNLSDDGFVPTLDPMQGTLLRKHTQVVVEEKKEEGVLTKKEIAEILDRSSDPSLMLPLESKYWTKQQLEMFVMSGGSIRPAWCSIPDERLMANTNMTREEIEQAVNKAADWIANADAVLLGSGAGMGVDSGLGTFRGSCKGVWAGLEAVGLAYEEICNPKWFQEEPLLGWAFWNFCHEAYQATTPHEGYARAREWAQRCPLGFYSFTSNIDSHWTSSGMPADRVLEVHGAVKWLQCSKPCSPDVWKAPKDLGLEEDSVTHRVRGVLPCCPKCKAVARPNVQMFGGDSGFSKARRGAQFSRYDQWLKQLEARPDRDVLRITCVELGCGLTVPTVRNELESVVKKFPQARLVRINPENPGLSTELTPRGVSLPLGAGFAIEELSKQVLKEEDLVTFILWGDYGGGCEIRAPYRTCLGRLIRLCEQEDNITVEFSKLTRAVSWGYGGKRQTEIRLEQPVDTSSFSEVKAGEGPDMRLTVVLFVGARFTNQKDPSNYNPALLKRGTNVLELLREMSSRFEDSEWQEKAQQCTNRRAMMQHLRAVQFAVLPKFGIEATERGTMVMAAWISAVQTVPEIQHEVDRSMEVSHARTMNQLPAVEKTEKPKPKEAPSKEAQSKETQSKEAAFPPPAPDPLQVVCSRMPTEDGTESNDKVTIEATTWSTIWELREKLAAQLGWDQETSTGVKFVAKQGNSFLGLKDADIVRKHVYVRNCPPLQAAMPVEVTFKEMAPEEGQAAKTFALSVMSDDKVSSLRQSLGDALGWDTQARKAARFLIRLNKESFGALKDHEKVQARKVIYVHSAPMEPTAEALARAASAAQQQAAAPEARQEEQGQGEPKEERHEEKPEEKPEEEEQEQAQECTGDIEVNIQIDPNLDLKMPFTLRKGSTVKVLKQILADSDPQGVTTIDTFWLMPPGAKTAHPDTKRLLTCCTLVVCTEPPPAPLPPAPAKRVCPVEQRPPKVAEQRPPKAYFIAGSWLDFKPTEMSKEGSSSFVHTLQVSKKGIEHFQILLGGNWDTTYHPDIKDANPWVKYNLQGPDNKGHGLNWTIGGGGKNSAKAGMHIKIVVSVDDCQKVTKVTWRQVR